MHCPVIEQSGADLHFRRKIAFDSIRSLKVYHEDFYLMTGEHKGQTSRLAISLDLLACPSYLLASSKLPCGDTAGTFQRLQTSNQEARLNMLESGNRSSLGSVPSKNSNLLRLCAKGSDAQTKIDSPFLLMFPNRTILSTQDWWRP